jgi:hypothetical protein
MGRLFKDYLRGTIYTCAECDTHVAKSSDLISRSFKGRTGTAFLFTEAVNYVCGPLENRLLLTGLHTIADIYCTCCDSNLGWKYEEAFEENQKYKEGKVILEKATIRKVRGA